MEMEMKMEMISLLRHKPIIQMADRMGCLCSDSGNNSTASKIVNEIIIIPQQSVQLSKNYMTMEAQICDDGSPLKYRSGHDRLFNQFFRIRYIVPTHVNDTHDILINWRNIETLDVYKIQPNYMSRQMDINSKMRAILIDWMVQICHKILKNDQILHHSVAIMDRFLAKRLVSRTKLQLIGCVAILLASKMEHRNKHVSIRTLYQISDKAYDFSIFMAMEIIMLNALNYSLSCPTPPQFYMVYTERLLGRFANEYNTKIYLTGLMFLDFMLDSGEMLFCKFKPSQLAAASLFLSMYSFNLYIDGLISPNDCDTDTDALTFWTPAQQDAIGVFISNNKEFQECVGNAFSHIQFKIQSYNFLTGNNAVVKKYKQHFADVRKDIPLFLPIFKNLN